MKTNSLLSLIHKGLKPALEKLGFRFEIRKRGAHRIGLWRLRLRPDSRKETVRRWVIIPGFGDTPLSWGMVMASLLPFLRGELDEVVFLDFPGFLGMLWEEKAIETMDLLLEITSEVLFDLKPEILLGHSLGGWLAAHFAIEAGKREKGYRGPEKLILASPSGVFGDPKEVKEWEDIFRNAMQEGFSAIRKMMFQSEPLWFRLIAGGMKNLTLKKDIQDFLFSVEEKHRLHGKLGSIQSKVWLIWGENDRLVLTSWLKAWQQEFKKIERVVPAIILPKTGHNPMLERPWILSTILKRIILSEDLKPISPRFWKQMSD